MSLPNSKMIKEHLNCLEKNKWYELPEIQEYVKLKLGSFSENPEWKHRLQAILEDYKKKGIVEHKPLVGSKKSSDGKYHSPEYLFKS